MNKDNAKDYLPLVQALAVGRQLQLKLPGDSIFHDVYDVVFQHAPDRHRIKPEPRCVFVHIPPRDLPRDANATFQKEVAKAWVDQYDGHITEMTE